MAVYVRPKRAGVVGGEGVGALPNMRGFDDAVGRMGASVQRCPWGCALSVPDDDVSSYPSRGGGTRSQSAGHGRHDKQGQGSPVCGEDGRPQGTTGADGARKESADQCPPSLTGSSVQGRGGSPHSGVGQGASVRRVGRGTVHSAVRDAVDGMFVGCLWTCRSVRGQTFRFPRSGQARTWCAVIGRFGSREGHACSVPPWAPRGPGGDSKCSMSVRWYLGVRSRSVAGLRGFGGTCGGIRGGRRRVCRGGKAADAKELLTHQTGAQHQVVPVGVDRVPGKPRQHVLARTPPTTASPPPSRQR